MKNIKIEMKEDQKSVTGTSYKAIIDAPYSDIVKVFGDPNAETDAYKIDAEWHGKINGKAFTIYNYKDGQNYLGREGLLIEKITEWHIGAFRSEVADLVKEYFNLKRKEEAEAKSQKIFKVKLIWEEEIEADSEEDAIEIARGLHCESQVDDEFEAEVIE